jgi:hypothetical protein
MNRREQKPRILSLVTPTRSDRGVFTAPWTGPHGELVLLARTAHRTLVCDPVVVPEGASCIPVADELWNQLERAEAAS